MDQESRSLKIVVRAAAWSAWVGAAALLLSGCPSPGPRPQAPSEPTPVPAPAPAAPTAPALPPPRPAPIPPPTPPPRENHLSPATRSLVTQAHALASHGDLDGASSTLDRALRIEPNNPLLWIELGRLRLTENDAHQAEGCARKALRLASGDRTTQAQAGRLLADALRNLGRNPEALEVERQPYMR
jgi:tetratricopeptide (TPR) repeat protein